MVKGLAFFTIVSLPTQRVNVRVLCPGGSYNEMGSYESPRRAREIVLEMYHTWAWELTPREFEARLKAREGVAIG